MSEPNATDAPNWLAEAAKSNLSQSDIEHEVLSAAREDAQVELLRGHLKLIRLFQRALRRAADE